MCSRQEFFRLPGWKHCLCLAAWCKVPPLLSPSSNRTHSATDGSQIKLRSGTAFSYKYRRCLIFHFGCQPLRQWRNSLGDRQHKFARCLAKPWYCQQLCLACQGMDPIQHHGNWVTRKCRDNALRQYNYWVCSIYFRLQGPLNSSADGDKSHGYLNMMPTVNFYMLFNLE